MTDPLRAAELLLLKQKVEALSKADQLRLCADLIDRERFDIAEILASNVVDALRAVRLFQKAKP